MENEEMKFKVGDNVKVVDSGDSYTSYVIMFRRLNFRNTNVNPSAIEGTIGTVFGILPHTSSNGDICVAIRDKFGTEYLIEQGGLMLTEEKSISTSTTKVTRKQLGDIYPLVCKVWKDRITQVLSQNPFSDTVEVDNELLLKAYQAGSNEYHINWLDKVTGGIDSLKPQVELGKWYWVEAQIGHEQDALIYVQDLSKDCKGNYGFNHAGKWLSGVRDKDGIGSYAIWNNLDLLRPATDTEVFEALKKEAIRRGLIEGVRIKSPFIIGTGDCESVTRLSNSYELRKNSFVNLGDWNYTLMRDGIWATPIEEPIYIWLKTKRKGKMVIERHPEKQLVNLLSNGWEVVIESDLERIKNEL